MQTAKDIKGYRQELREALSNDFQRTAMDNFAVFYRGARARAFAGMDLPAMIADVAAAKDAAMARLDELLAEFTANAQKAGITVHVAATADEANAVIADIARAEGVKKIVKSKSMTAEETLLNHRLEADGYEVTETDLGEWIIQLRHEGPTHMVMPAIHLSRAQVADLFSTVTGQTQEVDIPTLVKVARRELRRKFVEADMGISGANFALADTGTLGMITNEGNGRLVTTLPRVHVALLGLDKLVPSLADALKIIKVLPRNATAQAISSYVTWITGPNACAAATGGKKSMHIVFLDNGRRKLAADPVFSQALRCVRCGACANVCPIYRQVGGHTYGHIYIGAVGLVLTYFYHGRDKAKNLVQNCLNCGACKAACVAGIDLPYLIKEVHARILAEEGRPFQNTALSLAMRNRTLFHGALRAASLLQKPVTGGTQYLRHLPMFFAKDQEFRALPAIAAKPLRDRWSDIKPRPATSTVKAALFSGCVQDFVYPEQAEAAVSLFHGRDADLAYPMDQTCCGLPALMMGEKKTARDVALQNIAAFDDCNCDYILTLCASCASHLKKRLPAPGGRQSGTRPGRRTLRGQGHGFLHLRPRHLEAHPRRLHRPGHEDRPARPLPPVPGPGGHRRAARHAQDRRARLRPLRRRGRVLRFRRDVLAEIPRAVGRDPQEKTPECGRHRRDPACHRLPRLRHAAARRRGQPEDEPDGQT